MKIGIDCRMLGPEQGGIGRYVEQLVYHLSLSDQSNEYVLFLRAANFDAVKIGNPQFNYQKVLADIPWYGWKEQIRMPAILKAEKLDLVHFPHWNIPLVYRGKFMVTVHDLIMYHYPRAEATTLGPLYYWVKEKISRFVLRHAVRRAVKIIVPSEYTKQDVAKFLSVPIEKMVVTYQAAGLVISKDPPNLPTISKPYVLYVGAAYPHKNLSRLIEAWPKIQAATNHGYQLVLAGHDSFFYKKLKRLVEVVDISDVVFTGFVSDQMLDQWYRGASLFVYPSLYEGFGLPPLEAWARQIPVVAAKASCLPEILGQGALYFEAESVDELAKTVITGLTNEQLRQKTMIAAQAQQAKYAWKNCAQKTLETYNSVL